MSGFHILPPSWSINATITGFGDEAGPTVGPGNLFFYQPSRKWRTSGLGALQLVMNTGSPKPWNGVSLLYSNASSGTIEVTSSNVSTNLFTTPPFSSGVLPLRLPGDLSSFTQFHTWVDIGALQTYQYIGVEINDNSNPSGFFQAGVLTAGVIFEPKLGPDLGAKTGVDDPSTPVRMLNGEALVVPRRGIRVGSWSFPKQDATDTIRWRELNQVYGSKIPIVVKWDPIPSGSGTDQHTFYYGYAQWRKGGPITSSNGHGLNDVEMGIEEV